MKDAAFFFGPLSLWIVSAGVIGYGASYRPPSGLSLSLSRPLIYVRAPKSLSPWPKTLPPPPSPRCYMADKTSLSFPPLPPPSSVLVVARAQGRVEIAVCGGGRREGGIGAGGKEVEDGGKVR